MDIYIESMGIMEYFNNTRKKNLKIDRLEDGHINTTMKGKHAHHGGKDQ